MWLFCVSTLALIASPGPDFFYVLGRGMAQGPRAGLLSALGISLGLCVHTMLAVLGLSAILATSPWLFWAVKMAGAAYLFWIGLKMLRSSGTHQDESPPLDSRAVVQQAMLTNLFNPKAALTFLAYLPQWVRPQHGHVPAQFALLGATTVLMALTWFAIVGVGAAKVGAVLRRHPKLEVGVNRATGLLLLALGVMLALQKK